MVGHKHIAFALLWALFLCGTALAQPTGTRVYADCATEAPGTMAQVDGFVQAVYTAADSSQFHAAGTGYLWLLSCIGLARSDEDAAVLNRHLHQLALIVPDSLQPALHAALTGAPTPDLAPRLVRWWRRQDPLPATPANERLQEHLARVRYAEAQYPHPDHPTGLDARGVVYVRLGPPGKHTTVPLRQDRLVRESRTLTPSDFYENAYWVYPHLDDTAHYLFVRDSGHYREAEIYDLVPRRLRTGAVGGGRNAGLLRSVLEKIYGHLAIYNVDLGPAFNEVANLREGQLFEYQSSPSQLQPIISRQRTDEARRKARRDETVPLAATNVFDTLDLLPVGVRTARFLEPDGQTRLEVYWSTTADGLNPSKALRKQLRKSGIEDPGGYLLVASMHRQTAAYETRTRRYRRLRIQDVDLDQALPLHPQTDTLQGRVPFFAALQWDQHVLTSPSGGALTLGPHLKTATHRIEGLPPLRAAEDVLEISDLKPMISWGAAGTADPEHTLVYPFTHLTAETALMLYFEVYHLTFDANDQTQYDVTYEVARRSTTGVLRLRDGKTRRTQAVARYTGASRTAREAIAVDLRAWDGRGTLDITVRVTDTLTGRQVSRTLDFAFASE